MEKRIIFALMIIMFSVNYLKAQYSNDNHYRKIEYYLKTGIVKEAKLGELDEYKLEDFNNHLKHLSYSEKSMLTEMNEADIGTPFLLNLVLGLGIGSFYQGDTYGGFFLLLSDVVGFSMMQNEDYKKQRLGRSIFVSGRITGLFSPLIYKCFYDSTLDDLMRGYSFSYKVVPDIRKNRYGLSMIINLN